ncbi:MAG: hypothetical protein VSS52_006470 [Thiotrichaceae bacterium]|nr:hypothetical protein [Thiotrichaceae bacterium]
MKTVITTFIITSMMIFALLFSPLSRANTPEPTGCLSCHNGIEGMGTPAMQATVKAMSAQHGDPEGCIYCHGGNPEATTKEEAHTGSPESLIQAKGPQMFYPDPGSIWINDNTCGQSACHAGYATRLEKALMNTEAGKLQGNLWTWGYQKDQKTVWGNYDLKDEDGNVPSVGTDAYKDYMVKMMAAHTDQFADELKQVPDPKVDDIPENPNHAGLTYSRQECQRCHVGVTGREKRGDFRGSGCSACHVPYSNDGFYEGNDPSINKDQPGHILTHQIQGTRKNKVKVGDIEYSGIPTETCNSCHNRGKRIGVSYQGIMEFPYGSPYDEKGNKQPKLHTKKYLFIKDDLHHQVNSRPENPQGGMLCQDCHTSIEMHGDGNIPGTTLAQVEIECSDCHGTPDTYPWDLPLGYGEEFKQDIPQDPRGLGDKWPAFMAFATYYEPKDGYILSARGNPLGNVVKDGEEVILHSASGTDFKVPILKKIKDDDSWRSLDGKVAMTKVASHMENMECYACHADWVPQCYGCHITVDYSEGKTNVDWIRNANARGEDGLTPDAAYDTDGLHGPGKVSETRSYLRWETPILGVNGEGRVTPMMPGCQVITTVIDKDGNTVAHNKIWETPEGPGLDMAAVQPHTAGRQARTCESCHNNPKTLGYGIEDGRFNKKMSTPMYVDLETAQGEIIPSKTQIQSQAVPGLDWDLTQIVTRDGKQLVSSGSHWPLTGPLSQEQREKMERTGVCMGCHKEMTNDELWSKVNSDKVLNDQEHIDRVNQLLRKAAGMEAEEKAANEAADKALNDAKANAK